MREKWIGETVNTSGSYVTTICDELQIRHGGTITPKKLYRFKSRFGEEYYITDRIVLDKIEELLAKDVDGLTEMYEYLYSLVVEKFGMIEFLVRIGHRIADERNEGYLKGKNHLQKEMRELIGL